MQVSIEISLYPLNKEFIPLIDDFINRLKSYTNIEVRTNAMSTQLYGDFEDLIQILKNEVEKTFRKEINSVFNLKIVNGDSRKYDWSKLVLEQTSNWFFFSNTMVNSHESKRTHSIVWDATNYYENSIAAGMDLYSTEVENFQGTNSA